MEYVGWCGWVGHYHVAVKQLLEGEALLGDVTRDISIITAELKETLRPEFERERERFVQTLNITLVDIYVCIVQKI